MNGLVRRTRSARQGALLAVIAVLALLVAAPAQAQSACPDADLPVTSGQTERLRTATTCLLNAARRAQGLPALVQVTGLQKASQAHADDMVERRYFEHEAPPPAPRTSADRASAAGYRWAWVAENLAAGLETPRATVDAWLRSSGHCRNMLSSQPLDLGVGIRVEPPQGDYAPGTWVMTLGRSEGTSAPVTGDGECPSQLPASVGGSPAGAGAGSGGLGGTSGGGSDVTGTPGTGSGASGASPPGTTQYAATIGGGLRFASRATQRRGARFVHTRVRCARRTGVCRAMVYLTVRSGGKVVRLARRSLALRAGRTITLRTTLTPVARRRLARRGTLDALLSFRAAGSAVLGQRIRLRAR